MFWKTCLDHTFEILLALLGSGLLGYLWSRWMGSPNEDHDIRLYESQIQSLRERIKQQDLELKSTAALKDSWLAEKNNLHAHFDELNNTLSTTQNSYSGFVSSDVYQSLQSRFDQDIKSAALRIDELAAERTELIDKVKSLEIKLANIDQYELKYKEREAQWAVQLKDIQAKDQEINNLKSNLEQVSTNFDALEKRSLTQIQAVHDKDLTLQSSLNTQSKEFEQQLQSALSSKDEEVKSWRGKYDGLEKEMHRIQALFVQTTENEQAMASKLNEQQARIHHYELELQQAKSEAQKLKSMVSEVDALHKTRADAETKTKEWEGRWKEAATEADHYKLAHAQIIKERDQHKQHIAQLESDIINSRNQLEQSQQAQEATLASLLATQEKYTNLQNQFNDSNLSVDQANLKIQDLELRVKDFDLKAEETQSELNSRSEQFEGLKHSLLLSQQAHDKIERKLHEGSNWEQRFHDTNNHLQNLINELDHTKRDRDTQAHYRAELETKLADGGHWEQNYNEINHRLHQLVDELEDSKKAMYTQTQALTEMDRKWQEASQREHHFQELTATFSTMQNEFEHTKIELQNSHHTNAEWDRRYQESNHKLADALNQLEESKQAMQSLQNQQTDLNHKWHESQHHAQNLQNHLNAVLQSEEHLKESISSLQDSFQTEIKESNKALSDSKMAYSEIDTLFQGAQSKLNQIQIELEDVKKASAQTNVQLGESEARFKELNSTFNTVQLQLAEAHRSQVQYEFDRKKAEEFKGKYQTEVSAWQKQIADLEQEYKSKESIQSTNYAKAMDNQRKQISIQLAEIEKLKALTQKTAVALTPPVEVAISPIKADEPATEIILHKITNERPKPVLKPKADPKLQKTSRPAKTIIAPIPVPIVKPTPAVEPKALIDWKEVATTFGKKIKPDDHKIVEGIGPKIEKLLRKNKITTWVQLANTPIKVLQAILDTAGTAYSLAEPASWPSQARLASMSEWKTLKKLQEKLNSLKKKHNKVKTIAPKIKKVKSGIALKPAITKKPIKKAPVKPKIIFEAEKARLALGSKIKLDDLKIVEGIGPKIEKLLKKGNIKTWKQLATSELKVIQTILDKAGSRYTLADPKTWAKQSALAADGKWESLKKMKEKLKGRK